MALSSHEVMNSNAGGTKHYCNASRKSTYLRMRVTLVPVAKLSKALLPSFTCSLPHNYNT